MNKRLLVMMSALVMSFSAMPICSVYAETDNTVADDVQNVLPEWIPQNFTEALHFDNKYGRTHIEDGLICCVRKKYNRYVDAPEYLTEYSGESANECEPLVMFNETYNFVMPEKPDESDTEAYQEYLDFLHENYIEESYIEYFGDIQPDFEYEVTVYAMNPSSSVDINWIRKNPQTHEIVEIETLSFESSENGEVTETDIYGWFPDSASEYISEPVSIINNHIVFCDDICGCGGFSLVFEQTGTAELECVASEYLSLIGVTPDPPGTSSTTVKAYKPLNSGKVKVTFKEAQDWEGGSVGDIFVRYYNVDDDGNITEIDGINEGDCNNDGKFGISDVLMFQKWLSGTGEIANSQNADFTWDNNLDVFDLVLMKQALLENLPEINDENNSVSADDITILKKELLAKYPDTDMSDFTFVYEPDHKLNSQFNGKLFSVYYKNILLHGYGDINTSENVYAVIKNEKDNMKSVDMNFMVAPECFNEVNLDGKYKYAGEIKKSIDKYEMESAVKGPQFIIYLDWISGFNYELKPAYLVEWHDYERIYDAVTGEEIEYIPYFVV